MSDILFVNRCCSTFFGSLCEYVTDWESRYGRRPSISVEPMLVARDRGTLARYGLDIRLLEKDHAWLIDCGTDAVWHIVGGRMEEWKYGESESSGEGIKA